MKSSVRVMEEIAALTPVPTAAGKCALLCVEPVGKGKHVEAGAPRMFVVATLKMTARSVTASAKTAAKSQRRTIARPHEQSIAARVFTRRCVAAMALRRIFARVVSQKPTSSSACAKARIAVRSPPMTTAVRVVPRFVECVLSPIAAAAEASTANAVACRKAT